MKTWTQAELDALVACDKRTLDPPKKSMRLELGSYRNEATLQSLDGQHSFRVFIRQNAKFTENFTIGLDYIQRDEPGSICLLRCNGPHGPHVLWSHHAQFHIHKALADNVNGGRKSEAFAEVTASYASLEEAIRHFGSICHITDWNLHFPDLQQLLFKDLP
jgi:hypothetical protein